MLVSRECSTVSTGLHVLTLLAAAGLLIHRTRSCRAPFLLCQIGLVGAVALFMVGKHISLWAVARILQGASAGMLWVVCLALITKTVGPKGVGNAVGSIGLPLAVGPIAGTMLGGVIYDRGGYFASFAPIFVLLSVVVVLGLVLDERESEQKSDEAHADQFDARTKPDIPASSIPRLHSSFPQETAEKGQETSMRLPNPSQQSLHPALKLLLSWDMIVCLVGGFLQSSLMIAFDTTLPLVVNTLFGWQQTGQGLVFMPFLTPFLLQPKFGSIADKYMHGRRLLAATGCFLPVLPFVGLGLVTENTLSQKVLFCALLVMIGLGMAMSMPSIFAEISTIVKRADKQDAWAWSYTNVAYAGGDLFGPLFAGFIHNAAGWRTTAWSLGLLSAFTGVFLLLFLGGWIGKLKPKALTSQT